MTCQVCSAKSFPVTEAHDANVPGANVVGLRCGHFNVITAGAPAAFSTYQSNASTTASNAFNLPGAMTSANAAAAQAFFVAFCRGNRK